MHHFERSVTQIEIDVLDFAKDKLLKHLNRVASKPPLDLEFQDLKYSAKQVGGEKRQILKSINGKFCSGELTAIMGPSGAGKSTLLNILAGYVNDDVEGTIMVNGLPRELVKFKRMSSYIMQENITQPFLTVKESMMYAVNLKISEKVKKEDKIALVEEIIHFLGLDRCVNTYSDRLSGGQCKRLTIALELLGNSPIVFLDEPTTGLDDFTIKQCISLLKKISNINRTVVCTIHQPPASLLRVFDQIYVVADGQCVYNGSPSFMVPFLASAEYPCPSNSTPADYIIELVSLQKSTIEPLVERSENGKRYMRDQTSNIGFNIQELLHGEVMDVDPSFRTQLYFLLSRMCLQGRRNKSILIILFLHHLFSGILIGLLWEGTGNNAKYGASIAYCVAAFTILLVYTHAMIPILIFPLEVVLLKREYFNRWYSLKAYFVALSLYPLPIVIAVTMMYLTIIYFITDQPKELYRFAGFCLIGISLVITSQSLGYLIGSVFGIMKGSIVGPSILVLYLVTATYGAGYEARISPFMKVVMHLSFIRHGIIGFCDSIFYKRGPLLCDDIFCMYAYPEKNMTHLSLILGEYVYEIYILAAFTLLFRIFTYWTLKFTLNHDLYSKVEYYVKMLLGIKH